MFWIRPSTSTPESAPNIVPLPPLRLTPPMTAAAKTVKISPALAGRDRAQPAGDQHAGERGEQPARMNTLITMRSVRMPAARAASTLPPMA